MKSQYILQRKAGTILATHLDKLREAKITVVTIAHAIARVEGAKEEIVKFVKAHPDFTFRLTPQSNLSSGRPSLILPFREPARV